jgi:hypothetical protein
MNREKGIKINKLKELVEGLSTEEIKEALGL